MTILIISLTCRKIYMVVLHVEVAPTDQNSTTNDVELLTKVLGLCSCYLRSLNHCVMPSSVSSSSSNAYNISRVLEKVRSNIEKLRTKQDKLEA